MHACRRAEEDAQVEKKHNKNMHENTHTKTCNEQAQQATKEEGHCHPSLGTAHTFREKSAHNLAKPRWRG